MTHTVRRAMFLDRDGVINVDHGYVYRVEQLEFVQGIFDLCRWARRMDFLLIVITNQAGIARGCYSEYDFHIATTWLMGQFEKQGCPLSAVYYCPYHEHGTGPYRLASSDRKPYPGMIARAARDFGLDLAASTLIGDKESDIAAGQAAGVGVNILLAPDAAHAAERHTTGDRMVTTLHEVRDCLARWAFEHKRQETHDV